VKAQYSKEVAIDDLHVNGALTAGENISDMGGVKLAHDAMQQVLRSNGESGPYRFNAEQQFFIAFAQNWCGKARPELARLLVRTDPHSPFRLRVNVPLSNLESFQRAFSCPTGAKMARLYADRCEVW